MGKPKTVTLSVHRAIVSDDFQWTIGSLLQGIKSNIKTIDSSVDRDLFSKVEIGFPSFPETNDALAVKFALYEEGSEKSTILKKMTAETYSTGTQAAEEEHEFLDREVAILVDGNIMLACGLGNRCSLLIESISKLADRCGIKLHPTSFVFVDAANKLTLERIQSAGVKCVKFDATYYLGNLDNSPSGIFDTVFGPASGEYAYQKQEMTAEVIVSKTKLKTELRPKNEWLGRTAIDAFQDEDISSYTIVLDDDTEWREGHLKLKKSIKIPSDGSTFNEIAAFQAMMDYHRELKKSGLLA